MTRRRTGAISAALSLLALGSPLMTGCSAQTTIAEGGSNQAAESDSAYRRAIKDEIAELTKSIGINPQDSDAYNNRGNAKFRSGDYQGAISDYTKAIEIYPEDAFLYRFRGNAKELVGDLKGACADWRKASSLDDKDGAGWVIKEECQ